MTIDRESISSVALIWGAFSLALLLCWGLFRLLISSPTLVAWLDDRHPWQLSRMDATLITTRELWHYMRVNQRRDLIPTTIPIIGSSSTVNGVEVKVVNRYLPRGWRVANFGLSGLFAYEIPLLKDQIMPPGRRGVVFLYNPWMFPDKPRYYSAMFFRYHPQEMARLMPWWKSDWSTWKYHFEGLLSCLLPGFRFQELLQRQWYRLLVGELHPAPYYADFSPRNPTLKKLPSDPDHLLGMMRWYRESDTMKDNLGWRGMRRFLELARQRGVKVLVLPVPWLLDNEVEEYAGIHLGRIERRVAALCREYGASYLPRKEQPRIPYYQFIDRLHMHLSGRLRFSRWLGPVIARWLRREVASGL